jgi:DNA-binding Xre family transcriptional regulator
MAFDFERFRAAAQRERENRLRGDIPDIQISGGAPLRRYKKQSARDLQETISANRQRSVTRDYSQTRAYTHKRVGPVECRLTQLLRERRMRASALARLVGVTPAAVSFIARGARPALGTMWRIAGALQVERIAIWPGMETVNENIK